MLAERINNDTKRKMLLTKCVVSKEGRKEGKKVYVCLELVTSVWVIRVSVSVIDAKRSANQDD